MLTIWKFPIPVQDTIQVEMPKGARMLTVQVQDGEPCIWATVNPENEKEVRHLCIFGTGHPIEDGEHMFHRGTFQMQDGARVFHLFEYIRPS